MRALILVVLLAGCGPVGPKVWCAPEGLSPAEQAQAVAQVYSGAASSRYLLRGWTIGVQPYPLRFNPPILTGDFGVVDSATSITFLQEKKMLLTWRRSPQIQVEDLAWEIQNVQKDGNQ